MTDMQETFIAILDNMSGKATNKAMKQELGWEEGDYHMVRSDLIKAGIIKLGRCRGGMVMFAEATTKEPNAEPSQGANQVTSPLPSRVEGLTQNYRVAGLSGWYDRRLPSRHEPRTRSYRR